MIENRITSGDSPFFEDDDLDYPSKLPTQISEAIWLEEPPLTPLLGRWKRFTSAEAFAWLIRGCPDEAVWEKGILEKVGHPKDKEWPVHWIEEDW